MGADGGRVGGGTRLFLHELPQALGHWPHQLVRAPRAGLSGLVVADAILCEGVGEIEGEGQRAHGVGEGVVLDTYRKEKGAEGAAVLGTYWKGAEGAAALGYLRRRTLLLFCSCADDVVPPEGTLGQLGTAVMKSTRTGSAHGQRFLEGSRAFAADSPETPGNSFGECVEQ